MVKLIEMLFGMVSSLFGFFLTVVLGGAVTIVVMYSAAWLCWAH